MNKNLYADYCQDIMVGSNKEERLGPGMRAYKMDGIPDMRSEKAQLGSVSCCDYLWVEDDRIFLIEETELSKTITSIEREYFSLNDDEHLRSKFVRKRIKDENCLKVYGSMLVLCRMGEWPENKPLTFILLISGEIGAERVVRRWDPNGDLEKDIKNALLNDSGTQSSIEGNLMGGKLVSDVLVMTATELRKKLSGRVSACS